VNTTDVIVVGAGPTGLMLACELAMRGVAVRLLEERRDMPNILLSHNPNSFNRAAELGIELSLAGHTHGGQVQVEILDVSLSPARFITDYIAGLYHRPLLMPDQPKRLGETIKLMPNAPKGLAALYVNRGIGTITFPIRHQRPAGDYGHRTHP